ncbi:hypothetical protein [Rhodococcus sp. RDE2]|uniref:hypothetical protein n=1 Tax=Rhodococcus sp. RDE2 TaxID=2885078 RepID=UPI001E566231|nr:hypothetical protein [Rhodococcus sp. RDE2]BDB63550.1 hypothetical protein RDE2_53440 [Rhodococcus sp. RDE2]
MTSVYVPWQHDNRARDFTLRDHDATETSLRAALHQVKTLVSRGDTDGRSYRDAMRAYREARTRLYEIRGHLPANGLRREYEHTPPCCPDPFTS